MTVADWCILAAAILPYLAIAPAKLLGRRHYDNADPRNAEFYRTGFRARALGAHLNSFEAFAVFAPAVLLAEMREAPQTSVDLLAVAFILARVVYIGLYMANLPTLRSIVWGIGFIASMALFALAAVS